MRTYVRLDACNLRYDSNLPSRYPNAVTFRQQLKTFLFEQSYP